MEAIPSEAFGWWPAGELSAGVRRTIVSALDKCFDSETAAGLQARCPVPGTNVQDYLSRLLATADGRCALTSTRFRAMRTGEAFVQLDATGFAIGARDLAQLIATVKAIYRRLHPHWLRIYVDPDRVDPMLDELLWLPDLVVVAGPLAELRDMPRPHGYDEIELIPWAGDYDRYAAEHARFGQEHPRLAREVLPFSADELATLAAEGWLFDAFDATSRTWIGAVGAGPDPLFGAPGIAMYEELLAAQVRGRGLGRALQRHLIDRLPGDGVLWGTIHAQNQPSLRTAHACGRRQLGAYRLYELGL